jgi:hypothetical protein
MPQLLGGIQMFQEYYQSRKNILNHFERATSGQMLHLEMLSRSIWEGIVREFNGDEQAAQAAWENWFSTGEIK